MKIKAKSIIHISAIFIVLFGLSFANAQNSLPEVEKKLKRMAFDILNHDSLEYKQELNKTFSKLLIETLQRPESYEYNFDSLRTLSVLRADDNSFRVFTWYIEDTKKEEYFGKEEHFYFGLIQRKYTYPTGKQAVIVIPLIEGADKVTKGSVEGTMLDNTTWLGGLYYPEKGKQTISGYEVISYENKKGMKKVKYKGGSFTDEKGRFHREGDGYPTPEYVYKATEPKPQKRKVYLVLGWNGSDNTCNYKFADVIWFDPAKPDMAMFGSPIFYYSQFPKFRNVFKYSENSPFSLNSAPVKINNKGKALNMIVYDHLAMPRGSKKPQELWELGADGTQDGLFFDKRKKRFVWYKDVTLVSNEEIGMTREKEAKIKERLEWANKEVDGDKYDKSKDKSFKPNKYSKLTQEEILKREAEERAKLDALKKALEEKKKNQ
ncbi:MAG: hypothetical protein ACKVTZ_08660 [Bacteroidia bacterium]